MKKNEFILAKERLSILDEYISTSTPALFKSYISGATCVTRSALFMILKIVNRIMTIGKKKEEEKVEAPVKSDETILLEEIRDLLKKNK